MLKNPLILIRSFLFWVVAPLLVSLTVLFPNPASADGAAQIVLASDKVEPCPVVIMTPGGQTERSAGTELAGYLKKITGQTFLVTASSDPIPQRAILVGPIGKAAPDDLGEEDFIIKTEGQKLRIVGGGERGTLYGVYWFLEECLGCRWWSYNEEDVPQKPVLSIPKIDITQRAAFQIHDLFNREAQNTTGNFIHKIHANSAVQFTGNHTLYPLLRSYAEKHPEYWPMDEKGERKPNDLHFNYSAPGIAEDLAEALGKEIDKRDGDLQHYLYQAGMGDWYGGLDWSAQSRQVHEDEAWTDEDGEKKLGLIAPLLLMMNRTAEILDEQHPGVKVSTFAYMSTEAPPAKTRPADNVCVWIPRLRHDTVLSVEESDKNLSFRRNVEQWVKIAPGRVYIWEYGANFNNFMAPFPCLHSMASNISYYHRIGVRGIMIQGNYVSTGGDLAVLKNYVWRKLLWQSDLDIDALIREFCEGYYGPASAEMLEYVTALEDSVRKPQQIHADEFDESYKFLTPEFVARLRNLLKQAAAKTQGNDEDPYYRRVREAGIGFDSLALWAEGPLEERDGKLIRTDIDKENGGQYTFERALETTKYSRNASPREFGAAIYYQGGFLTLQGGPLYTLHRANLAAKVAPYNPHRIWQVLQGKQIAIDGSWVSLKPRAIYFEPAGEPTGSRVEMTSNLGIEAWSPEIKQTANETVELTDDHTIRIVGMIAGVTKEFEKNQPTIETHYGVENEGDDIQVEAFVDNQWRNIEISMEAPKAMIPPTSQLRITRHSRRLVITDKYLEPLCEGGELIYDAKENILKTIVKLSPVSVAIGQAAPAYKREIEVESLGR